MRLPVCYGLHRRHACEDRFAARRILANRALTAAGISLCALLVTGETVADGKFNPAGRPVHVQGVFARPVGQIGVNASSSSASTTVEWTSCTGASDCILSFDYFVDSEPGYDQLRLWLDAEASPRFSVSGYGRGHKTLTIPLGTHTVRFEYFKDGSLSAGADTAWVDNVTAYDSKGRRHLSFCDDVWSKPTAPWGWTSTGYASGWVVVELPPDRAVERPASQYHQPGSTSYIMRTITVPAGSSQKLSFEYFLDSEPNDALRVYMNGVLKWQMSGREKHGVAEVPLPAGTYGLQFAYEKNATVDAGLDLATVDNIRIIDKVRAVLLSDFAGLTPLSTRIPNWLTSSTYPWTIRGKAPHISVLDPGFTGASVAIDGSVTNTGEYGTSVTAAALPRYTERPAVQPAPSTGVSVDDSTKLSMFADGGNGNLHLVMLRQPWTDALGGEVGTVTVYVDARRDATLAESGCPDSPVLPGPEDRRFSLAYNIPSGGATAQLTGGVFKGTCSATSPWEGTSAADTWAFAGAAREDIYERTVTIELRLALKASSQTISEPFTSKLFGLGINLWSPTGPSPRVITTSLVGEHFPYLTGQAPDNANVRTWETIMLGPAGIADAPLDGCCTSQPVK